MLIAGVTMTVWCYSQTPRQLIEKQIKDPQRKSNAGKADGIIASKRKIFDSTNFNENTTDTNNNKTVKANIKKKYCGNKTKQSSRVSTSKRKG